MMLIRIVRTNKTVITTSKINKTNHTKYCKKNNKTETLIKVLRDKKVLKINRKIGPSYKMWITIN